MEGIPLTIRGDVDAVVGDIRHEGDVIVRGSVDPGYTVHATGDLTVRGHVTRATLRSGGNILVMGIASGRGSMLDAVGSVTALHVLDSRVQAGIDIEITSAAERSELWAGQRILLRGAPGLLRGGEARAGRAVEANRVEASASTRCYIHVGDNPFAASRSELADRLAFALSRIEKARRSLGGDLGANPRSVIDLATYRQLAGRLTRHLRQYDSAARSSDESYVEIGTVDPREVEVTFGREGDAIPVPHQALEGAFAATMRGGDVVVSRIQEGHCVG